MIALQTMMGLPEVKKVRLDVSGAWRMPAAVLTVDRIYDIPELVWNSAHIPEYRDSVAGAFGDDERVWAAVSPPRGNWLEVGEWSKGSKRVMVIAHGYRDELVDWGQVDLMTERVERLEQNGERLASAADGEGRAGWLKSGWDGCSKVIEFESTHHEVWETGEGRRAREGDDQDIPRPGPIEKGTGSARVTHLLILESTSL